MTWKELISITIYLLCYCSEASTYYILSFIYSEIIPEYAYPNNFKKKASQIDDDISFLKDILKENYQVENDELKLSQNFLES